MTDVIDFPDTPTLNAEDETAAAVPGSVFVAVSGPYLKAAETVAPVTGEPVSNDAADGGHSNIVTPHNGARR